MGVPAGGDGGDRGGLLLLVDQAAPVGGEVGLVAREAFA